MVKGEEEDEESKVIEVKKGTVLTTQDTIKMEDPKVDEKEEEIPVPPQDDKEESDNAPPPAS